MTDETAVKVWLDAFNAWSKRYGDAFDKDSNATGDMHREHFPDAEERKARTLEGMMLAVCFGFASGCRWCGIQILNRRWSCLAQGAMVSGHSMILCRYT